MHFHTGENFDFKNFPLGRCAHFLKDFVFVKGQPVCGVIELKRHILFPVHLILKPSQRQTAAAHPFFLYPCPTPPQPPVGPFLFHRPPVKSRQIVEIRAVFHMA